jgi:hypothetical protein
MNTDRNLDRRLQHAFSDLETRVNESLEQRPNPSTDPSTGPSGGDPRRPGWLLPALAGAAIAIVVIGAVALFTGPSDGPDVADEQGTVTTAEAAPTTTPADRVAPETAEPDTTGSNTTGPDATAPDPSGSETSTTTSTATTSASAATSAPPAGEITGVPAAAEVNPLFGAAIVGGRDGISTVFSALVVDLDLPAARAVFATPNATIVYQDSNTGDINLFDSDGGTTTLVAAGDGERLRLMSLLNYPTSEDLRMAYTIRSGTEDESREILFLASLADLSDVIEIGMVGGFESGLMAVSAANGFLLTEISGEGFVWWEAYDADGVETELPIELPGPDGCGLGAAAEGQTCPTHVHLMDAGRVAFVAITGDQQVVVVEDADGDDIANADISGEPVHSIDVSGPSVIINRWDPTFTEPDIALLLHIDSETLVELPRVGLASIPR